MDFFDEHLLTLKKCRICNLKERIRTAIANCDLLLFSVPGAGERSNIAQMLVVQNGELLLKLSLCAFWGVVNEVRGAKVTKRPLNQPTNRTVLTLKLLATPGARPMARVIRVSTVGVMNW